MTDSITITLPAINPETINALETAREQEHETVVKALGALRENYAPLAKHNGYIKIAYHYRGNSNYTNEQERFYEDGNGKKMRAFLVQDAFDREYSDQNRGTLVGTRLYLVEDGSWLEIERSGDWSAWQGEPEGWTCGLPVSKDDNCFDGPDDEYGTGGNIKSMTDEEVAQEYDIDVVVAGLSSSLEKLAKKIPERMTRVQQKTAIAAQLLAALGK